MTAAWALVVHDCDVKAWHVIETISSKYSRISAAVPEKRNKTREQLSQAKETAGRHVTCVFPRLAQFTCFPRLAQFTCFSGSGAGENTLRRLALFCVRTIHQNVTSHPVKRSRAREIFLNAAFAFSR